MMPLDKEPSYRFNPLLLGVHNALMMLKTIGASASLSSFQAAGLIPNVSKQREFQNAVLKESVSSYLSFLKGVQFYEEAPRATPPSMPSPIWEKGSSKLFDLGAKYKTSSTGKAIFFIPSLVNKSYIFDLNESSGFLSYLAEQGIRSYLFDWGHAREPESDFSLQSYLEERLLPAFMKASQIQNGPMGLGGYCMGGLLAVALKQRAPSLVSSLSLLATPWNFHVGPYSPELMKNLARWSRLFFADQNRVPASFLQLFFHMHSPFQIQRKFQRFYQEFSGKSHDKASSVNLGRFLALEDWLNDTVPLPLKIFLECCEDWYGNNMPYLKKTIAGQSAEPAESSFPTCLVTPTKDRLVPIKSARGLLSLFPQATILEPSTGHVGLFGSARVIDNFWEPYTIWLKQALD